MRQKIYNIVICAENMLLAEKLKNAITKESVFFKQDIEMIDTIEKLKEKKSIDLLILILEKNVAMRYKEVKKYLKNKGIVVIDLENFLLEIKFERRKEEISKNYDERVIAFEILFSYFKRLERINTNKMIKYNENKLKKAVEKYKCNDNLKIELFKKIDEKIMENVKHNFVGYEEFKTIITFCKINKINTYNKQDNEYIYKSISNILKKESYHIKKELRNAFINIRRKKALKLQELLNQIKGKEILEQVIEISKRI